MGHTQRNKAKLLARVRRIRGHVEAVERALEAKAECGEVLRLIASVRGGDQWSDRRGDGRPHPLTCRRPLPEPDTDKARGAEELIDVVRTYLK